MVKARRVSAMKSRFGASAKSIDRVVTPSRWISQRRNAGSADLVLQPPQCHDRLGRSTARTRVPECAQWHGLRPAPTTRRRVRHRYWMTLCCRLRNPRVLPPSDGWWHTAREAPSMSNHGVWRVRDLSPRWRWCSRTHHWHRCRITQRFATARCRSCPRKT